MAPIVHKWNIYCVYYCSRVISYIEEPTKKSGALFSLIFVFVPFSLSPLLLLHTRWEQTSTKQIHSPPLIDYHYFPFSISSPLSPVTSLQPCPRTKSPGLQHHLAKNLQHCKTMPHPPPATLRCRGGTTLTRTTPITANPLPSMKSSPRRKSRRKYQPPTSAPNPSPWTRHQALPSPP